ncbi:unnamed protein product [Penicillium olsonii]|nr:unnamed protein product [Penicillium olsonii]CAG7933437.1 unnamed protein product [Penicillium olsonii]
MSCHQENLAQTANPLRGKNVGAVVDNDELDLLGRLSQTRLADFESQLEQWLTAESGLNLSAEAVQSRQNHTIFVVSFGVWDLWSLIGKDYDAARQSIERRIARIMEHLDTLSARWGTSNLKVILTQTVDVTFLPGFDATRSSKDPVQLLAHWNLKLREAAAQWTQGTIYLFDLNEFLMDRIRDYQLYAAGIEEASGLGQNLDGWTNVVEPCVASGFQVMMSKEQEPCEQPGQYLFWNEMHLGPSAHHLLAREMYRGIDVFRSNATAGI